MPDPFITAVVARERQKAYDHLYRKLIDWRKQLWPNRALDPIWREEHGLRIRAHLLKTHRIHPNLSEYFGTWSVQ